MRILNTDSKRPCPFLSSRIHSTIKCVNWIDPLPDADLLTIFIICWPSPSFPLFHLQPIRPTQHTFRWNILQRGGEWPQLLLGRYKTSRALPLVGQLKVRKWLWGFEFHFGFLAFLSVISELNVGSVELISTQILVQFVWHSFIILFLYHFRHNSKNSCLQCTIRNLWGFVD
jgi:hypothetical protein